MAKKRRKHQIEKEEKEYKPPPFDKKEFMETEINVAKGTIIAVLLSIPMGIAAFFVMSFSVSAGLLLGLAGIGVVYFVLTIIGIEVHTFKITHWLGVISSYFFLFLAVWILLCNPPFSDKAGPDIKDVRIMVDGDSNYIHVLSAENSNTVQIPFDDVNITVWANVTDNVELVVYSVTIGTGGTPVQMTQNQTDEYIFFHELRGVAFATEITISARDSNGKDSDFTFIVIQG